MKNKEAISVIENEIQIDVRLCSDEQVERFQTALYMAIAALRSNPPANIERDAWESCNECATSCWNCVDFDEDEDIYPISCQCCVNRNNYRPRFKFCSECGRPLTEEAWAALEKRLRG